MNDLELGHRLHAALDEYTDGAPLPNSEEPAFQRPAIGTWRSVTTPRYLRTNHPRRAKPRRLLVVLAVTLGLIGTGTGLAAASGAFDRPAHRAAVSSFDQSVKQMMQSIKLGFNQQFAGEYRSVLKTFKPKDIVFKADAHGPHHSIFTVWAYAHHPGPPWCQGLVVTSHGKADAMGFGCQLSGPSPVPGNAAQQSEWPCAPPSAPEYFVVSGDVPAHVARVALNIPGREPLRARATNGWFVTVTSQQVPGPVSETFFAASGDPIGSGTWNGGGSTC